jgi:hypothetical protein
MDICKATDAHLNCRQDKLKCTPTRPAHSYYLTECLHSVTLNTPVTVTTKLNVFIQKQIVQQFNHQTLKVTRTFEAYLRGHKLETTYEAVA